MAPRGWLTKGCEGRATGQESNVTRALLEIHLAAAVPAEQETGEQVDLLTFGRAVLRGDSLLRQVKGLLVNQRLMGIGEEILFLFLTVMAIGF